MTRGQDEIVVVFLSSLHPVILLACLTKFLTLHSVIVIPARPVGTRGIQSHEWTPACAGVTL